MSYDLVIQDMETKDILYDSNYTSNVGEMFKLAFSAFGDCYSIDIIHNKPPSEVLQRLAVAINYFLENRSDLKKLNPKNKWGSYGGALEFLRNARNACEDYYHNPNVLVRLL